MRISYLFFHVTSIIGFYTGTVLDTGIKSVYHKAREFWRKAKKRQGWIPSMVWNKPTWMFGKPCRRKWKQTRRLRCTAVHKKSTVSGIRITSELAIRKLILKLSKVILTEINLLSRRSTLDMSKSVWAHEFATVRKQTKTSKSTFCVKKCTFTTNSRHFVFNNKNRLPNDLSSDLTFLNNISFEFYTSDKYSRHTSIDRKQPHQKNGSRERMSRKTEYIQFTK